MDRGSVSADWGPSPSRSAADIASVTAGHLKGLGSRHERVNRNRESPCCFWRRVSQSVQLFAGFRIEVGLPALLTNPSWNIFDERELIAPPVFGRNRPTLRG